MKFDLKTLPLFSVILFLLFTFVYNLLFLNLYEGYEIKKKIENITNKKKDLSNNIPYSNE